VLHVALPIYRLGLRNRRSQVRILSGAFGETRFPSGFHAEIPRAVRRAVAQDPALPLDLLLERAGELTDVLALRPLDRALLIGAGALAEPALRALDATHVAAAVDLDPIEAFVTYDERQAAAARLAGLRTMAPGV